MNSALCRPTNFAIAVGYISHVPRRQGYDLQYEKFVRALHKMNTLSLSITHEKNSKLLSYL